MVTAPSPLFTSRHLQRICYFPNNDVRTFGNVILIKLMCLTTNLPYIASKHCLVTAHLSEHSNGTSLDTLLGNEDAKEWDELSSNCPYILVKYL